MVCPWKKIVTSEGYSNTKIVRTTFGECDEKECPFYSCINTRNTSGNPVRIENCLRVMTDKPIY